MTTNFHLSPPVKLVDGLTSVPIDIQVINGLLHFDGSSQTGEGDVTIEFIMGPQDGNPIFDLRQTILEAWLDGVVIDPAQLSHHDFGGGAQAELRIVESILSAGSMHQLRMRYALAHPQASSSGSYQPNLSWNSGPRLIFNFGFTDLGPGRYLEAWVPANLIFDQYPINLELQIENTTVPHSVITNGTATTLGDNHWQISWPAHSAALSPLLELRSSDSVEQYSDSVVLPISSDTITIEAWKLTTSLLNLSTQVNNIKNYLIDNEANVGHYIHDQRFVAFFHVGGMEYDGGTTTSTGALRHETFHSWWGRGVKPASQTDAWWDEAWTTYNMSGGSGSFAFDFSAAPIELSSRNPWSRKTPSASYDDGRRFFEGLAALDSSTRLQAAMDAFYASNKSKVTTTTELEAHLLCQIGKSAIVDGFHRFVYGFADPFTAPDIWLKDAAAHTGSDYWSGTFWNSPDLWVRNQDDDDNDHQSPEYGQDNWFYARVRNQSDSSSARHFAVTFNVASFAGLQFQFPDDFLPCTAASVGFELEPGESRIVKARWPRALVPPTGTHACLLASVLTRGEQPGTGLHVWEHNNLAQKNLTVVNLQPDAWIVIPVVIRNVFRRSWPWFELIAIRPPETDDLDIELLHPMAKRFRRFRCAAQVRADIKKIVITESATKLELDCGGQIENGEASNYLPWTKYNPHSVSSQYFTQAQTRAFSPGKKSTIGLTLPYGEQLVLGLKVHVPKNAKPGTCIKLDFAHRLWPWSRPLGGIAVEIHVKE